ncbi:Ubiquitin conjugation factor E4 B [Labeo rohita]|uniref:Ubiquitin conjugation factor E4 B n=1 Tax=Labeo rohita TaxID=84645 RepID=A0ABQ8MQG1_LABRO|nr:Ubiquitin conjugation factor E4 B [Labeo rohita]
MKSNNSGFVTCEQHLSPLTVGDTSSSAADAAQLPTSSSCCEQFMNMSNRHVCNSSFVKADYTWANFVEVLFQNNIAILLANQSIIRMDQRHDHLKSNCYSPTSMKNYDEETKVSLDVRIYCFYGRNRFGRVVCGSRGCDNGSVKVCFVCVWRISRTGCFILNYLDDGSLLFLDSEFCGRRDMASEADKQLTSSVDRGQRQCPVVSGRWESPCLGDCNFSPACP